VTSYDAKVISDKVFGTQDYDRLRFTSKPPPAGTMYVFVSRSWKRWSPSKSCGGPHVFHVDVAIPGKDGRYLVVDDEKQATALKWFLSRSRLMRYLSAAYASCGYVPPFMWDFMPTPKCLLEMDDAALLQEFGIVEHLADVVSTIDDPGRWS